MKSMGHVGSPLMSAQAVRWYANPAVLVPAVLLLVYLVLYIFPLGHRPLVIPDETRYSEIPREMLVSGDWVTPRLDGLRYFEKPPLGYWLNALSIATFGENEFAVRLPGTLAAGLTSLIAFLFSLKVWHSRRIALAAALIHMTFLEVYLVGTFNVLDNFVTCFLTVGIYAAYLANVTAADASASRMRWLLAGTSFGLAFLAKGFLAFAIPVLVLVPWMLWQGRWRMLLTRGWWAVLAAALVIAPWAILIHLREGDFWHYFFWVEHIKRFTAENAQHRAPAYYFLMYLPALAFPWLSLMPAAIAGLRAGDTDSTVQRDALRLLWLWLLLPLLFFSASSGKLATYILPIFPPFAVLIAVGLSGYLRKGDSKLFDFGMLLNVLIFFCLLAGLVITQTVDIGFRAYGAHETLKFTVIALTLLLGAGAGLATMFVSRLDVKLAACIAMIVFPLLVITFVLPEETLMHNSPGQQLLQYRDRINRNSIVLSDSAVLRATAWYLKREDIYLVGKGELGYGLDYPDSRRRFIDAAGMQQLLRENSPGRSLLMVCKRECPAPLTNLLPATVQKHAWGVFTFWYVPPSGAAVTGHPLTR
jgi:4-amino-4-deoxy-L-arabinose transferase